MNGYNDPPYYISAYGLAKKRGFAGSLDDWLNSLVGPEGPQGKTAYQYAVDGGFVGTEEEFAAKMAKEAAVIASAENMNKHMLNTSNPHGSTAVQVGALPLGGGAMQGPIVMGGYKVTGLGEPAADGDAVPLGFANKSFAPAGFGLGTDGQDVYITDVAEIDNIKANGWYTISQNVGSPLKLNGVFFNLLNLEVSMLNSSYGTQIVTFTDGYQIRRTMDAGEWQPWDSVNPPMVPGVEYRTTERCEGLPVYAKRIAYTISATIGNDTSSTDTVIAHGISDFNYPVRCFGIRGAYPLPFIGSNGGSISINQISGSAIVLRAYKNTLSDGSIYFDLYYTKTT